MTSSHGFFHSTNRRVVATVAAAVLTMLWLTPSASQAKSITALTDSTIADQGDIRLISASLVRDYGLSVEEATRRARAQQSSADFIEAAQAKMGDSWAGGWVDHSNSGRVEVASTDPDVQLPDPSPFGLAGQVDRLKVKYSYSYLSDLGGKIFADDSLAEFKPGGYYVQERTNKLIFMLDSRDEKNQAAFERAVRTKYGEDILDHAEMSDGASSSACSATSGDPPLRGGLSIWEGNSSSNGYCTSGVNVETQVSHVQYLLTAGHCIDPTWGYTSTWYEYMPNDQQYHAIGSGNLSVYGTSPSGTGAGDAGILLINNPAGWDPEPILKVNASWATVKDDAYDIYQARSYVSGTFVCYTGATQKTVCGELDGAAITRNICPTSTSVCDSDPSKLRKVTGMANIVTPGCAGDSGAPVYIGGGVFGIVVARDGLTKSPSIVGPNGDPQPCRTSTLYQGITGATAALGVRLSTR